MGEAQQGPLCPADFLCSLGHNRAVRRNALPELGQVPRLRTSCGPPNLGVRNPQLKKTCAVPRGTRSGVLEGSQSQLRTGNSWVWEEMRGGKEISLHDAEVISAICPYRQTQCGVGKSWISLVFFNSEEAERFRCEGRDAEQRSASHCQRYGSEVSEFLQRVCQHGLNVIPLLASLSSPITINNWTNLQTNFPSDP